MVMRKGAFDVVKSRRESNANGRITFPKRPFSVDFPGSGWNRLRLACAACVDLNED